VITKLCPPYPEKPWKRGGGSMFDIAEAGDVWRFSRTPITESGPFSDYTGHDRCQVLIKGRGLVLETPDGEIDVRTPFKPVRFAGETKITSRLEAGPVMVINLIGKRSAVRVVLGVFEANQRCNLPPGIHFAYCPVESAVVSCEGADYALADDHALRLDLAKGAKVGFASGRIVIASVIPN
jgi:environmental stress-induced protein Ves